MIVGIDPGTSTGFALWDSCSKKFAQVKSLAIHRAFEELEILRGTFHNEIPVIFEDARQRTWFGHTGREVLQGAGAAKRDATIWQDYLEDHGTPYHARKPSSGSTKWSSEQFRRLTGWQERTNEHGRDAGVLVFGLQMNEVQQVRRSWEQLRANAATRTQARR